MDIAGAIRQPVRAAAFATLTAGTLAAWYPLVARTRDDAERRALLARFRSVYTRVTRRLFGVDAHVLGGPLPRATKGRLVVANHRSGLDIVLVAQLGDGVFLSRGDVATWPLLGEFAKQAGTLFVDREDHGSRASAVRAIRSALKAGETVCVFAEGATFAGDDVRPFHPGAFLAARGLDVDVVAIGLAYAEGAEFGDETFGEHLGRIAARRRTRVAIALGASGPMPAIRDVKEVAEHYRARVEELVRQARAAV